MGRTDDEDPALAGVQRALAALREPAGAGTVMDRGLRALCEHCGFSRAVLFRLEGSELIGEAIHFVQRPEWAAELLLETRRTPMPMRHTVLETEMLRRRTAGLVLRPQDDPHAFKDLTAPFLTRSYAAAPLSPDDRVVGFLHADHYFDEGRHVDEHDRLVLAAFAEGFAMALHRAVLLDRLALQRRELRRLIGEAAAVADGVGLDGGLARADDDLHASLRIAAGSGPPPDERLQALLTPRELEVLELMAAGATNAAIARRLVVSEQTAKTHVSHVLRKLRATNRAAAVSRYHAITNRGR
ncbi:LuxR C-terminal-related transcriptional regulator [Patulibacter defluvii]|uniref:LuxR C-terminal-related transcriptional regulator n=1 Tax=Patulibacter defluvii TaxID=3095358 RepID=UPI002A74B26D|nr:LuxR C-terminal-related transcriptional regulator [Patulibacter sp. DM4]